MEEKCAGTPPRGTEPILRETGVQLVITTDSDKGEGNSRTSLQAGSSWLTTHWWRVDLYPAAPPTIADEECSSIQWGEPNRKFTPAKYLGFWPGN